MLKLLVLLFVCLMTDCYSVAQAARNSWQFFCLSLLSAQIKGVSNLPGFTNGLFWQLSFSAHQNMPRAPNRTAHLYDTCSFACLLYKVVLDNSSDFHLHWIIAFLMSLSPVVIFVLEVTVVDWLVFLHRHLCT